MAPGGRHIKRMPGNTLAQSGATTRFGGLPNISRDKGTTTHFEASPNDTNMILERRAATTRFGSSPNVTNVGPRDGAMTTHIERSPNVTNMITEGRSIPRMTRSTCARSDASRVSSQALPSETTCFEDLPNINIVSPRDGATTTHIESSPEATNIITEGGSIPRMTRSTRARTLPSDTTSFEDLPNISIVSPRDGATTTHIESSLDTTMAKDVRKKTRNDSLTNYIKIHGKPRIEIEKGMMTPVGLWSQFFVTEIGIIVRMHAPFEIHDWRKLKKVDKRKIFHPAILEKFDIDLHVHHVEKAVHKYMGIRFRNYRCKLHKKYVELGGDAQYKRRHAPSGVSADNWVKLCVHFESDDFQKTSKKNSENRELQEVNHCAGTLSFARFREMKRDPVTGKELGRIDLYRETHFSKKKKDWVAPITHERYNNMIEVQTQATQENDVPPNEDEICVDVLGKRKGYILGLGHGVMSSSSYQDGPTMEEIRRNGEETNMRLEAAERRAEEAEASRDVLSLEMVNQARKIEDLENFKARFEFFMSSFNPSLFQG